MEEDWSSANRYRNFTRQRNTLRVIWNVDTAFLLCGGRYDASFYLFIFSNCVCVWGGGVVFFVCLFVYFVLFVFCLFFFNVRIWGEQRILNIGSFRILEQMERILYVWKIKFRTHFSLKRNEIFLIRSTMTVYNAL